MWGRDLVFMSTLHLSDRLDGRAALQNKLNLSPESMLTSLKEFTKTSSKTERKHPSHGTQTPSVTVENSKKFD